MNTGGDEGELALAGRWSENVRISVVPAATSFTLHILYPDTTSVVKTPRYSARRR